MKTMNSLSGKKKTHKCSQVAFGFVVLRFDYHMCSLWSNMVFTLWSTERWGCLRPSWGSIKSKLSIMMLRHLDWWSRGGAGRGALLVPWCNQGSGPKLCQQSLCSSLPCAYSLKEPSLSKNVLVEAVKLFYWLLTPEHTSLIFCVKKWEVLLTHSALYQRKVFFSRKSNWVTRWTSCFFSCYIVFTWKNNGQTIVMQ